MLHLPWKEILTITTSSLGHTCMSSFLFCCCNKMAWQKQLKEERIHFGLQFKATLLDDKDIIRRSAYLLLLLILLLILLLFLCSLLLRVPERGNLEVKHLVWVLVWRSWRGRHGGRSTRQPITCICIHEMMISGCCYSSHFILCIGSQRLYRMVLPTCRVGLCSWMNPLWKHLTDALWDSSMESLNPVILTMKVNLHSIPSLNHNMSDNLETNMAGIVKLYSDWRSFGSPFFSPKGL